MSVRKTKIQSKALASRLRGFSAFGFGASFEPPEADSTVVRELLISLEDRRALYVQAIWEQPEGVTRSVQEMRSELTTTIKRLGDGSPAAEACRVMRAACRDFVSIADLTSLEPMDQHFVQGWQGENFLLALGALRSTLGQQIAVLAYLYEVDLEEHLAAILPPVAKR